MKLTAPCETQTHTTNQWVPEDVGDTMYIQKERNGDLNDKEILITVKRELIKKIK